MSRRTRKLAVLTRVLELRENRALQRLQAQRQKAQRELSRSEQLSAMQAQYRERLQKDEQNGQPMAHLHLGRRFNAAMADAVDAQVQTRERSEADLPVLEDAWRSARARRQGSDELARSRLRAARRQQERRERLQQPPARPQED